MKRRDAPVVRILFAIAIGVLAALTCLLATQAQPPNHPADFGQVWFGATALLHGANPYDLVGPGLVYDWPWPTLYPATSFVAAMPLALLPQTEATLVFVFMSWALLAYSVTRDGWYRIPMFGSAACLDAAAAGQWSPLMTAAMGIPVLALFFAAKPTDGLALGISGSDSVQKYAVLGGAVLAVLSFIVFPGWVPAWLGQMKHSMYMAPPLLRLGGFAILLAALRWRRPEARMMLALSLVPQAGAWYTVVPLFLIPNTMKESMVLATLTSVGFLLQDHILTATNELEYNAQIGALLVAFAYLPCLVMVLRRPNEGRLPAWPSLTRVSVPKSAAT